MTFSRFLWVRAALGGSLVLAAQACSFDERKIDLATAPLAVNPMGSAGSNGAAGPTEPDPTAPGSEGGPNPTSIAPAGGGSSGGQSPAGAGADAGPLGCVNGSSEQCGPDAEEGICKFGTLSCSAGQWGECTGAVFPALRDCTSDVDNDCDGQPDNTVDDVCRCQVGGIQVCEEHPGQDGKGRCRAGSQACVFGAGNASSDWGTCSGSVAPGTSDSCDIAGDDSDCDSTPNGGCTCVEGAMVACGPDTDTGICQRGTSTCGSGAFGACQGAVFSARRDCSSAQDNDCDGRPDGMVDAVCTCVVGTVQACGAHPGRDGFGPCRAGSQSCVLSNQNSASNFGACQGAIGPAQRDSCTVFGDDSDCNGVPNSGCQCVAGRGNTPCAGDANNSRCNAQGQCAPCQANADCSLVSAGRNLCVSGVCTAPRCGDGTVSAGEQCDDGNATNGDGCSAGCRVTRTPHGAVSFGAFHMCTPLPSGQLRCWGANTSGQLGTGDRVNSATPVAVTGITNAIEVASSDIATCALLANGTVSCWGAAGSPNGANLGVVGASDSNVPVPVPGLANLTHIAGGGSGFCAVRSSGAVVCWGDSSPTEGGPADKGLTGVVQVAGGNLHFCGVRGNGTLACWGSNIAGQFGNGQQTGNTPAPVETPLTNVAEVAAGGDTTCVRLRSGAVNCFGRNSTGALGNNTTVDSLVPVAVANLTDAVKLAGSANHFCALTAAQSVKCWGVELGGGGDDIPTTISLPSNAVDVGAGADASCALLSDDSLRCWGADALGQLGSGSVLANGSAAPLRVLNIP